MASLQHTSVRQREITEVFLNELDKNLFELINGTTEKMVEINEIADALHIHPRHLTNTVKLVTGKSPCDLFEGKILVAAKQMIVDDKMNISSIANLLTYDPSNFTKFFKRFTGKTPKQFREETLNQKTEHLTI
ncbi:helix-turn-helix domain-containing protein [Rufibacter hautae]|uniref:Helix-turn-helix transcriptional regulator n=1 Tax=Rufibacter hautae TaxID=2595005 RepID=A0A5B6TIC8_9BACT|nr:AraC family transcriptional regulator [Rufibacter hautae]KAA3440023.1 helix-turn-helix transcriptional regulator [Rufibacter hautae]